MAQSRRKPRGRRAVLSQLRFLPLALLATPMVSQAFDLQSLQDGQQKLFPGRKLTPADFKLTPAQFSLLKSEYRVPAMRPAVKAWQVEGGGWLFLDQVWGLNDVVSYLVAVADSGKLLGIEVLVCADGYCDLYTRDWRGQLVGLTHGKWQPTEAVTLVSGATLSCTHVAEGVKKVLAIHARFRPGAVVPGG